MLYNYSCTEVVNITTENAGLFLNNNLIWSEIEYVLVGIKRGKSAYETSGPSGRGLSRFLKLEATRNISTPPEWDANPSLPQALSLLVPTYTLGWGEAL